MICQGIFFRLFNFNESVDTVINPWSAGCFDCYTFNFDIPDEVRYGSLGVTWSHLTGSACHVTSN